ncbi:MAG: aminopeptidase P family protein [Elusimicrobiota bacterium]
MKNIHKIRTEELQQNLKKQNIDAILISSIKEAFFITGFHQDRTVLLLTKNELFAFLPKMFVDHFKNECDWANIIVYENLYSDIQNKIKELKLKKVIFDGSLIYFEEGKKLLDMGLENKTGFFKEFRMIKKLEEFENIKTSCEIAAKSFSIIKPKIKPGIKEIEVARELEYTMQKLGASTRSFETIVGFGSNSALPHHETSERKLKKNEVVLIDFGCIYKRYCSDMTRTFFYGKATEEFRKVYSIVEKAQKEGIKAAKEGIFSNQIDKISRDIISENGYGQYFTHGTGHGVGLEIHEEPYLNTRSSTKLREGMVVTVEPGIYLYGKFGVRIEDTIYIRKKDSQVLTKI